MGLFWDTTTTCAGKMRRISVFSAAYQYKVCVCLQSDFKMAGLPGLFLNWKFTRFRWNEKGKKRKLNVNGSKKHWNWWFLGILMQGGDTFPGAGLGRRSTVGRNGIYFYSNKFRLCLSWVCLSFRSIEAFFGENYVPRVNRWGVSEG